MDGNDTVFEGATWKRNDNSGDTAVFCQIGASKFMVIVLGKYTANRTEDVVFDRKPTMAEVVAKCFVTDDEWEYVGPIAGGVRYFGGEIAMNGMTDFTADCAVSDVFKDEYRVSIWTEDDGTKRLAIHNETLRKTFYYSLSGEFLRFENWLEAENEPL